MFAFNKDGIQVHKTWKNSLISERQDLLAEGAKFIRRIRKIREN